MDMEETTQAKRAILDLEGANCTSCSIAIEHFGRRLDGVREIVVDRGTSTVQVEYDGDDQLLTTICDMVDRLGYKATVRQTA